MHRFLSWLLIIASYFPLASWACECIAKPSVQDAFAKSPLVFAGRLVDKNSACGLLFTVERVWKGEVLKQQCVLPYQVLNAISSCDFEFWLNRDYLIYATSAKPIVTHKCTRTRLIEEASEDFKELGPGHLVE